MLPLIFALVITLAAAQCFCPNGKCLPCPGGTTGCFPYTSGACCGCYNGQCWACPRSTQCDYRQPNWCNSTCPVNNCRWPDTCKICLDGNQACFQDSQWVCCGCVNGQCYQCQYAHQCDMSRPGWCNFKRRSFEDFAVGDEAWHKGKQMSQH